MAGNKPYNEVTLKLDTNVKSAIELWVLYGIDPGSFARHMLAGDLHAAIASMHELLAEHFIDHYKYTQIVIRNWHPEFPIKDWRGWLNLEEEEARDESGEDQ